MTKIILTQLALFLACSIAQAQEGPPKTPKPIPCEQFIQDLPGAPLDAALTFRINRAGLSLRIVSENGRAVPGTYDFRENRVNIELEQRQITRAYCG